MKLASKDIIFLLAYPLAHMAVLALCFIVSDRLGHDSMLAEVFFMFVLLLIAPVLAFPRNLQEIDHLFAGWPAPAVFLLAYLVILLVYALPFLLLLKAFHKQRRRFPQD